MPSNFNLSDGIDTINLSPGVEEIKNWIVRTLSELLGTDQSKIEITEPLATLGVGSLDAVALSGQLEAWLGRELSPTLVWDYPSVGALALYLAGDLGPSIEIQTRENDEHPNRFAVRGEIS
jgi:acyl carrier protein